VTNRSYDTIKNIQIINKKEFVMGNIGAISLFSGAGGLDLSSIMVGIPVLSSIDILEDAIETLKVNKKYFCETKLMRADLTETKSIVFDNVVKESNFNKVLVIGGAPCQPFSKAGYWVGHEVRKGIKDSRAKLVNEYLRVVCDLKPDGFVFENVESLSHPTNRTILEQFVDFSERLGYKTKVIKANALDYGVPQKRKRLFIIGTKGEYKTIEPIKSHFPPLIAERENLQPYKTAGQAIREFDNDTYFEKHEITEGGTYSDDLKEVPPGKNYKALTAWAGYENPKFIADKRFWNFLLKLSPDLPSWTITAQPGPWVGPFHWTSRRLRVPEISALQSFPKDFQFYGNRRSKQLLIGNAVPPLMGKAMVEYLKESLQ
jgi:DNA (cytosine-5)-methyltransferase 1